MMNKLLFTGLTCTIAFAASFTQTSIANKGGSRKKIIVEVQLPKDFQKNLLSNAVLNEIELSVFPVDYVARFPETDCRKESVTGNKVRWVISSDKAIGFNNLPFNFSGIAMPGDSIHINLEAAQQVISGQGANASRLFYEINTIENRFVKPTASYNKINSLNDYLEWNNYFDKKLSAIFSLVDSNKTTVSPFLLKKIRVSAVNSIEGARQNSFRVLSGNMLNGKIPGLTINDIKNIYDSTMLKPAARWLIAQSSDFWGSATYFTGQVELSIYRRYDFNLNHEALKNKRKIFYQLAKEKYKGVLRERVLQYILVEQILHRLDNRDPDKIAIMNEYYSDPGFPEYKKWMKDYEYRDITDRRSAPYFRITDSEGRIFANDSLDKNVFLLNFWYTGCKECAASVPVLTKAMNTFKDNPNVVFLNVNTDKDKTTWMKSVKEGRYCPPGAMDLYTGGEGKEHSILKSYNVTSYPAIFVVNAKGKLEGRHVDLKDGGKTLTTIINKSSAISLVSLNDGPYIMFDKDSVRIDYIVPSNNNRVLKTIVKHQRNLSNTNLSVLTEDPTKTFSTRFKEPLQNEPSVFENVSKQLALSDIEGNFDALRKLLQANKVIDQDFNWTFGKGHLIFNGDMFDRGVQVTECLWLIYSLEEKAKAAGGYVHFIIGNHEIMNLQGNYKYVTQKYMDISALMNKPVRVLYNEQTALGRWLRTKNIMEKVGDVLYAHGGIAPQITQEPWTITDINNLARKYYGGDLDSSNRQLLLLYDNSGGGKGCSVNRSSPFWFRSYYEENPAYNASIPTVQDVDNSLSKFGVHHIVTGHTVVADTVSTWYGNRVINVDTKHAKGISEALLIENGNYYRVNDKGRRVLLFKED